MEYKTGDSVFIVENHRFIRRVVIIQVGGGLYTVRFTDSDGATRVRKSRLFTTEEEAEKSISGKGK